MDGRDETPLHMAAALNRNAEVIQALLDAGAEVNALDGRDETPLHRAAARNWNPVVIDALLNAGANTSARNRGGSTPWDLAEENLSLLDTDAYRRLNPSVMHSEGDPAE